MKEQITIKVKELRGQMASAERTESWSQYDYLEGLVDAYEIVLQMMENEK